MLAGLGFGLVALAALSGSSSEAGEGESEQALLYGLTFGVIGTAGAFMGFGRANDCKAAWKKHREWLTRGIDDPPASLRQRAISDMSCATVIADWDDETDLARKTRLLDSMPGRCKKQVMKPQKPVPAPTPAAGREETCAAAVYRVEKAPTAHRGRLALGLGFARPECRRLIPDDLRQKALEHRRLRECATDPGRRGCAKIETD